jgi:hypothetical protein
MIEQEKEDERRRNSEKQKGIHTHKDQ